MRDLLMYENLCDDPPVTPDEVAAAKREAIGRRVTACLKVWRWSRGMPITCRGYTGHIVEVGEGAIVFAVVMQAMDGSKDTLMIAVEILGIDPPDMNDPGIQGYALAMIAKHNTRRSIFDALGDAHTKVGRGLSFPEALVELIEECEAAHGDG